MAGVKNPSQTLTTISRTLGNVANILQTIRCQSIGERPLVNKVEDGSGNEGSQDLGTPVGKYLAPGESACCGQPQRYSRVEMGTAYCSSNVDAEHNGKTPPKDNDRPGIGTYTHSLCFTKEPKDCHTTIAKEDQHHRAEELCNHFARRTGERGRRGYRSRCHKCSLLL